MKIEFYSTSTSIYYVADFIKEQPLKAKKKISRQLHLLEKYGTSFVDMKKITKDIWEIRVEFNKIAYRILCVFIDTVCWLLHGFVKKTQKTPLKDIHLAENRANNLFKQLNLI